jgi:hypothetical protein
MHDLVGVKLTRGDVSGRDPAGHADSLERCCLSCLRHTGLRARYLGSESNACSSICLSKRPGPVSLIFSAGPKNRSMGTSITPRVLRAKKLGRRSGPAPGGVDCQLSGSVVVPESPSAGLYTCHESHVRPYGIAASLLGSSRVSIPADSGPRASRSDRRRSSSECRIPTARLERFPLALLTSYACHTRGRKFTLIEPSDRSWLHTAAADLKPT